MTARLEIAPGCFTDAPRAVPFSAVTFAAFKVSETGRTYPLGDIDVGSLKNALNVALGSFALHHKEHLLLRETSDEGVKVHLFAIRKKSAARYVHRDHVTRAVHDLYAAPVCSFDVGVVG